MPPPPTFDAGRRRELARLVPDRETAVVSLWFDDGRDPEHRRLRVGQRLAIGRAPDPRAQHRMTVPQHREPMVSRSHLVLAYEAGRGWLLSHYPTVKNPGSYRFWGDLRWRDADVHDIPLRRGLVAYRFPGEPRYLLTVAAAESRPALLPYRPDDAVGIRTADHAPPIPVRVSPAQRMSLTDALVDAVLWPPPLTDGRVRTWTEVSGGSDKDGVRKNYQRLVDEVEKITALRWTRGSRGADPTLLRKLIDIGAITYDQVYGQRGEWPGGRLLPTHHTHLPDGRRRTT